MIQVHNQNPYDTMDEAGDLNVRRGYLPSAGLVHLVAPVVKELIVAHLEKYSFDLPSLFIYRVLFLVLVVHRNRIWVFSVSRWESVCLFVERGI